MEINYGNIKNIPIQEQNLLEALLIDLEEFNKIAPKKLFIDWQDYHNEYSPERTDPCPDYYGCYTLRDINNPYEIIGVEMTINDLDNALCLLCNYF